MPAQLEPADLPAGIEYLWGFFCELSNGRDYGEAGPKPISWSDLQAWADLTKSDPTAWEVDVIKNIDRVFLNEAMKK